MSAYIRRLVSSPSAMNFTPSADNNVCCDLRVIQEQVVLYFLPLSLLPGADEETCITQNFTQ